MTTPSESSLPSLLADLHAHATRTGDAALQANIQQLEAALAGAGGAVYVGNITAGNITGSTAIAIGSDIQILVHQTTNLPVDLLTRLTTLADTLSQRAAETLDATGHTLRVFLASPGVVKDENPDGSIRSGYNAYETLSQFGDLFEQHLRKVLAQLIEERRPAPKLKPATSVSTVLPTAWPKDKSPFSGLRALARTMPQCSSGAARRPTNC
jgi:hypothetical protein